MNMMTQYNNCQNGALSTFKNIFTFISLLAATVFSVGVSPVAAQRPENILAAIGSPPNPKVPISWNRYHDHTALYEIYQKLTQAHPDLLTVQSIGKSHQGRDIWLMTVTDRN